jgi:uncharacterized membrane protein YbhN (UPF0104 family)
VLDLTVLSLLIFGIFVVNGLLIRSYCLFFGSRLEPVEWFGLSIVQTMGNYIPLRGGAAAQMTYVKVRHGLPFNKLVAGFSATIVLNFLMGGILGSLATGIVAWVHAYINWKLSGIFVAVAAVAVVLLAAPRFALRFDTRALRWLYSVLESWWIIRSDSALVRRLMILSTSGIVLYGLRLYTAYHALGYQVPVEYCLLIAPLASMSMVFSILPAGLGVREAVVGLASDLLGLGLSSGVYAAALDRAVSMIWVFVLGTIFSYVLTSKAVEKSGDRAEFVSDELHRVQ